MKHPDQPVELDPEGVARFKENKLVRMLLNHGRATGLGLNELAMQTYHKEEYRDDWNQLAQLIGYSVSGYGDLSYADEERVARADQLAEELK